MTQQEFPMKANRTLESRRPQQRSDSLTPLVLATVVITLCAGNAFAQQQGQLAPITVEASHQVQKKQVGMSYSGIPIEQVKLSRQVGYHDLNLGTPAGAAELEKRIKTTAEEACKQLRTLYPLDTWETDTRTCVADAVSNAMMQEKPLITAAQKGQ
jgi:UrcA family protein